MPKVLDIIEVIDTTYQEFFLTILSTQLNKKKESNLLKLREKTSQENLVKFRKDQNWILGERWNFKYHESYKIISYDLKDTLSHMP